MMRRYFLLAFALTLFATAAWPQPNKVQVIGVLMISAGAEDPIFLAMREGLRERGYVYNRDYRIEHRTALGQAERIPQLARELLALKVDVMVVSLERVVRTVKELTSTTPIVMVSYDHDPVASGLVASLNRPGGNVTGIATLTPDLVGKRLQILKETLPGLSRVAVFWDTFSRGQLQDLEPAARTLGIELQRIELTGAYDFDAAYTFAEEHNARAALMLLSPRFFVRRMEIEALAQRHKMPIMHYDESVVKAGGFISYGSSSSDLYKRAAYYIDRLLKGAKPQDLPIEQESRLKLVVNLKTAKALRITIPESVLLRADEVIQ